MVFELRKIALNIEDVNGLEQRSRIATRYELVGQGIESRWGRNFPHPSKPAPRAHPASYILAIGSFPAVKRPAL